MRRLYVPVTLTIAGAVCATGVSQGDLDRAGCGVILAMLVFAVARVTGAGRRGRSSRAGVAGPIPFFSTERGRDHAG